MGFKVSIRDDHLGFLRPLHHCFGGLLEAGQLQLSLADSQLEDPIQQLRGFQQSDMSCLLNSVKPLSKICCTSTVQINIVHRGPNSTSHLNFVLISLIYSPITYYLGMGQNHVAL